jgi:hypothetical protein
MRFKPIIVAVCAAFVAAACGQQQVAGPTSRPPSGAQATPTPTTSSRAADLRTKLDLLLGEHLILSAKATGAALDGNNDASKAYETQVAANAGELAELMGTAYGDQARSQFTQVWSAHDSAVADYARAAQKNDAARKQAALRTLTGQFLPRASTLLAGLTGEAQGSVRGMLQEQVAQSRAIVDDQAARNYAQEFQDIDRAYRHTQEIGDTLAPAISHRTGKFAGDVSGKAAGLRATLNDLLQEHLYAATAATGATLAGHADEAAAAGAMLDRNGEQLAAAIGQLFGPQSQQQFGRIWTAQDGLILAYAKAVSTNDAATRQKALDALNRQSVPQLAAFWARATGLPEGALANITGDEVQTIKQVVDDQGAKNYAQAAQDDATAADHMEMMADPLAAGIVARLPQRFA